MSNAFLHYFVQDFMDELWYLQKLARGTIPKVAGSDPQKCLLNMAQGLLGLIPNDDVSILMETDKTSTQSELDFPVVRILAQLIGRGLVERYDDVLSHYLNPLERGPLPFARVVARRLFNYMNTQVWATFVKDNLVTHRTRLLNGILLDDLADWRSQFASEPGLIPRIVKDMQKLNLPLQDSMAQRQVEGISFSPEKIIQHSAWHDGCQSYAHPHTYWLTRDEQTQTYQPKYGYTYLADASQPPFEMVLLGGVNALCSTFPYRAVGATQIQAYLNCEQVLKARELKKTTPYSFNEYLRETGHLKEVHAVCHEDLSIITDWSFSNFSGVDFSGSVVHGDFSGANFSQAYLLGSRAKEVRSSESYPLSLNRAVLSFCDWGGAKLCGADLKEADFSAANLSDADLTGVQSLGTLWYRAILTNTTNDILLQEQANQALEMKRLYHMQAKQTDIQMMLVEDTVGPILEKMDLLEQQCRTMELRNDLQLAAEAEITKLRIRINDNVNSAFHAIDLATQVAELKSQKSILESKYDLSKSKFNDLGLAPAVFYGPVSKFVPEFVNLGFRIPDGSQPLIVFRIKGRTDTVGDVRQILATARRVLPAQIILKFQGELLVDDSVIFTSLPGFCLEHDNVPGAGTEEDKAQSHVMSRFECFKLLVAPSLVPAVP